MPGPIKIKLKKIEYTGQPVGNDIKIEIDIAGQYYEWQRKMIFGSVVEPNVEIAKLGNGGPLDITIKVTEKDFIFSDEGSTQATLQLDPNTFPQTFDFEIKVQERRRLFRKKTAVFLITLEAEQSQPVSVIKPKPYNPGPNGEDYNLYDTFIAETVYQWNQEFNAQINSPPVLLDANLVKAIIYVESKMGHYPVKKDRYPSHPDIMQMANPADPAIHVLRDDGIKKTEYEIQEGKIVRLFYPDANGNSPQESIKWGVRWLYHKAQIIRGNQRVWLGWEEAVKKYGPGTTEYQDKVWNIYTEGVDQDGNKLWSISVATLILVLGSLWSNYGLIPFFNEDKIILGAETKLEQQTQQTDLVSKALLGCESVHGDLSEAYSLINSTYSIKGEYYPKDKTRIKLREGGYGYQPPEGKEWVNHDAERDGPYSVHCEKIERGDLNLDGQDEAVVVLRINDGSIGRYREIFAMRKNNERQFVQSAVIRMDDREEVWGVKIDNGILYTGLILRRAEDPQCCPSLPVLKKFKLENSKLVEINN